MISAVGDRIKVDLPGESVLLSGYKSTELASAVIYLFFHPDRKKEIKISDDPPALLKVAVSRGRIALLAVTEKGKVSRVMEADEFLPIVRQVLLSREVATGTEMVTFGASPPDLQVEGESVSEDEALVLMEMMTSALVNMENPEFRGIVTYESQQPIYADGAKGEGLYFTSPALKEENFLRKENLARTWLMCLAFLELKKRSHE